jgi:hypothetical protein
VKAPAIEVHRDDEALDDRAAADESIAGTDELDERLGNKSDQHQADGRATAASEAAYLVVVDVPADVADQMLEAALASSFGAQLWEGVRCDPFIDSGNVRHVLLCFDSMLARDQALALGAISLPGQTCSACELQSVANATAARSMEAMALESRCVCVRNLPLGIDELGIAHIFDIVDGKFTSVTIEDIDDEQGASAVIEFTASIAARRSAQARTHFAARSSARFGAHPVSRCRVPHAPSHLCSSLSAAAAAPRAMTLNMFDIDGRYLEVTLGSNGGFR